jgi:hypothetical protein
MSKILILAGSLAAVIGFAAQANAQGYYQPPPYRPDYPRPFPGPYYPRGDYPPPRFPVLRCVAPLPGYRNPPPVQICAAPQAAPGSPCSCWGPRRRLLPGWVE